MKNIYGNQFTVSLFGESHGEMIGCVIDGMPSGVYIDNELINKMLDKRKAKGKISTARHEADSFKIVSGVKDNYSEGTPITILIPNTSQHSSDYNKLENIARPGHADYTGYVKYHGYNDQSGGGHFSGRLTAPLVASGAIATHMLERKGIYIASHLQSVHHIKDSKYSENIYEEVRQVLDKDFPLINDDVRSDIEEVINEARLNLDSVGGVIETGIIGLPEGIGEVEFDSIESCLSHGLFSIPAIKGVEFGLGFAFSELYGSEANDELVIKDNKVSFLSNNNGGINGGISNGMPIVFRSVVKPTPSISKKQRSVDFVKKESVEIEIGGRHDPCIAHRACVVVDSICAITLVDLLMMRYGYEYFGDER